MYVSFDDLLELAHEDKQWAILEVALKFAKGDGVDRNDDLACEWIKKF
ncbi:MAG: hypothetical protein GY861_06800, partial [bacterium]|nr:hypothetical protein [bacterium]